MKYVLAVLLLGASLFPAFSQNRAVTVEINNIEAGKGTVFVSVYDSAENYKKQKPFLSETAEPISASIQLKLSLPAGEYVVSVYQDSNRNGKLDTNFVGMPKEPVGISNYSGKGIPGGFDKLKAVIKNTDAVLTVNMTRL